MTQQNARLADQSASVARSLTVMSDGLSELMESFKTQPDDQRSDNIVAETNEDPGAEGYISQSHAVSGDQNEDPVPIALGATDHEPTDRVNETPQTEKEADQEWQRLTEMQTSDDSEENDFDDPTVAVGEDWKDF